MKKIIKYVLIDILRNKIVLSYTALLLIVSLSIFNMQDTPSKGILAILNVVLIIVPLVSCIFSTIYIYNSAEFIELLVSQPLKRVHVWLSLFAGLSLSLSLAFALGCGLPVLLFAWSPTGLLMVLMGLGITVIFIAISLLAAVLTRDKARGIGVSLLLWLYFTIIFDGVVLFLLFQFIDYPLEKPIIAFSMLNPIDLARILILLQMDISAIMGATSALFKDFFGSSLGMLAAILVLLAWVLIPLWFSVRRFRLKDL